MHCDSSPADTKDHLIPRSWYPDSTPPNLTKWTFPSCNRCNNEFSRVEDELLFVFGMCMEPEDARAAGIPDRVLRAIDSDAGRTPRDREARSARRKRVQESITHTASPPTEAILPGFGVQPGKEYPFYSAIQIPVDSIGKVVRKLAKGLTFLQDGVRIPQSYQIIWLPAEALGEELAAVFDEHAADFERGPGIVLRRASASEDPARCVMWIELWGKLRLFVAVDADASHGAPDGWNSA